MAPWQVGFSVIPRSAFVARGATMSSGFAHTKWWAAHALPPDYQRRLGGVAPAEPSASAERQTWGAEDSNTIDVWSENGRVVTVMARVDVRRLDSKFGAALLQFVRTADALLVRSDGLVIEPTIAAYAGALRSSAAWRLAGEPASSAAAYLADDEDDA